MTINHLDIEAESDHDAFGMELFQHLRAYNESQAGPLAAEVISLSVRTGDGALVGGLVGEMFWDALFIRTLWVDEAHRRSGLGGRLMAEAERRARARPCAWIYTSTFEFQAPDFYAKQGFTPFGELPIPAGSRLQWFRKAL